MGYETYFNIEVEGVGAEPADVAEELRDISGYVFDYSAGNVTPEMGRCKWYSYEEDMLTVSRRFPGAVFTVYGEGEEQPDLWVHYFQGGRHKRHEAKIIYPAYNEQELA